MGGLPDNQVVLRAMEALSDEIGEALLVAHRKLEIDAKRFRSPDRLAKKKRKGGTS